MFAFVNFLSYPRHCYINKSPTDFFKSPSNLQFTQDIFRFYNKIHDFFLIKHFFFFDCVINIQRQRHKVVHIWHVHIERQHKT